MMRARRECERIIKKYYFLYHNIYEKLNKIPTDEQTKWVIWKLLN